MMPSSTPYQDFIFYRTYSRWNDDLGRRETWQETVDRYMSFMRKNVGDKLTFEEYQEIREAILKHEVMPSMRLMWGAGGPTARCNVSAYNCSYLAIKELRDFAETLYLLCSGTGVGFSVEKAAVDQLPVVQPQKGVPSKYFVIDDSKEGWAEALHDCLHALFNGEDAIFDFSQIRPAGARLKTMGGRAAGPQPLMDLLEFTKEVVLARQGKKLRPIDVHDIMTKIGEIVVAGGVRRSAMISLSDLEDAEVQHAKDGRFWEHSAHRALANNSAVYKQKPTREEFLSEWDALRKSGSGERGIFNRGSLTEQVPARRLFEWNGVVPALAGTNPCGEIVLKDKQFCNLTEIVARAEDTEETLLKKARIATILGTYQSTLTDFKFLSSEWKRNCEDERLLGVSITGQWDSPAVRDEQVLTRMKHVAQDTNSEYAKRFGINPSTAITCVKPSGTVGQLVNASPGLHARYSEYYLKRVRISVTDPLFKMLRDLGVPSHPEVGQGESTANTFVLDFPIASPQGAVTADKLSAIAQLEHWLMMKRSWTEHNPSCTIYIKDGEWEQVRDWIYEHWDLVGGLSFLPYEDHVYELAPYTPISKEEYEKLASLFPKIDFSVLTRYEKDDETTGAQELACVAGGCELDGITLN